MNFLDDIKRHILHIAVEHGMSYADAETEFDALAHGNNTEYTRRIRAIIASEMGLD